jgi:hypothetical protein
MCVVAAAAVVIGEPSVLDDPLAPLKSRKFFGREFGREEVDSPRLAFCD